MPDLSALFCKETTLYCYQHRSYQNLIDLQGLLIIHSEAALLSLGNQVACLPYYPLSFTGDTISERRFRLLLPVIFDRLVQLVIVFWLSLGKI
jgi:hypothetical protein